MSSIAVAIVNYNTREHLKACLATLVAEGADEVVVVDNASADGSQAMLRAEFPWVHLLENQHNPGYGGAANQAIAAVARLFQPMGPPLRWSGQSPMSIRTTIPS